MKINGGDAKVGTIIEFEGSLYKVVKSQHVKPGKGGAYNQVELKGVITSTKRNERFRSDEKIEKVTLEQKEYDFSYSDDGLYYFMDKGTFELTPLAKDEIGEDQLPYIVEGITVTIEFYDDKPIALILPQKVICTIEDTEAVIKGQTASSSYKPAILDNGVRTTVPPHIANGDRVVINTENNEYVERAKD